MVSDTLHAVASRLRGERILVTGAAGFIGVNLVQCLARAGCEVHGLIRPGSQPWRLDEIPGRCTIHRADVGSADALDDVFRTVSPRVVFHLAVPRGHDEHARHEMLRVNVGGAQALLQCVRRHGLDRLVVAGSSLEYAPSRQALHEGSPMEPVTWHGETKAAASLLYRRAFEEQGLPVVVLRLFHVYGPWESSHRLAPTALRAALGGASMPLTQPGIRRDWVFVDDVCEALLRAACQGKAGDEFNIGSGVETSNEDLVACVQAVLGQPIAIDPTELPARATDAEHRYADWSLAKKHLDWMPRHSLAQGLQRTADWFARHPQAWSHPADRWGGAV